jgi:glycosyltransferase involved in cell wall biosynthesis
MSAPRFSAVIAAYNEADYVGAALTSVLRQTESDWEAVVVDDGSTDETAEIVREFERRDPRIRLVSQPNKGLAGAINTGIEHSRAPYVGLLDADDLWMPRFVEVMSDALDQAPEAGFAYTDAYWFDLTTRRFRRALSMAPWNPPEDPPGDPLEMLRLLVRANFIFGLATMRRSALDRIGNFDASLGSSEDYDMWMRMLANGYRAARPPGVLAIRRRREDSMSMNAPKMFENSKKVYARVAENEDLPDDIRATARERIAWCDRFIGGLSGETRSKAAVIALRRRLSPIRRLLERPFVWRSSPPAEVTAAFPDLDTL